MRPCVSAVRQNERKATGGSLRLSLLTAGIQVEPSHGLNMLNRDRHEVGADGP